MEQQLILERYRPLEELGSGGFGEVVLAWDARMQRRVAIKRIPLPAGTAASETVPGLAEARTAALLNHPSIVTVFDFDTDSDEAFLIMEYVDGASLARLLDAAGGPLDDDEAAAVLDGVTAAIAYAHDNGVLHLDIKPENVLVTRDGRVKVADFGLAALSSAFGHGPSDGGTIGFMPLEQLEGARCTERTDVWALGALAYEMLADANPFAASTVEDAIFRLEVEDPPRPSAYARVPAGVDTVIMDALRLNAPERTRSVADFADELLPLLGDVEEGRLGLVDLVDEVVGDEELDEDIARLGLWDRLGRWRILSGRALAGLEGALLAYVAAAAAGLEPLVSIGVAALVALGCVLAPGLGLALALISLAVAAAAAGAWWNLAVVVVLGLPYWWLIARRSTSAPVLALAPAALAALGVPVAWLPVVPLLAGFTLPPAAAASTAFVAAALGAVAQMRLGMPTATPVLAEPAVWYTAASWALAAGLSSFPSGTATRAGAFAGTIVGGGVLATSLVAASFVPELSDASETSWLVASVPLALSLILMLAVTALGAPVRAEDDPRRGGTADEDDS